MNWKWSFCTTKLNRYWRWIQPPIISSPRLGIVTMYIPFIGRALFKLPNGFHFHLYIYFDDFIVIIVFWRLAARDIFILLMFNNTQHIKHRQTFQQHNINPAEFLPKTDATKHGYSKYHIIENRICNSAKIIKSTTNQLFKTSPVSIVHRPSLIIIQTHNLLKMQEPEWRGTEKKKKKKVKVLTIFHIIVSIFLRLYL